jgi:hypothetical protein
MIEGGATVAIAIIAILVLPDNISSCRWFTAEEKDYCKDTEGQILQGIQLTHASDVRALHEHGPGGQGNQLETGSWRVLPLATGHA